MFYSISTAASRGGRKYMEDRVIIEYVRNEEKVLEAVFVAVLDGHGGPQASQHVQSILWRTIQDTEGFKSDDDEIVLESMRTAFLLIHETMHAMRSQWPSRANGYPSTAGTTCSCALIRDNKIYTAHCGDSRILLVSEDKEQGFETEDLTYDHKPDDPIEMARIQRCGGIVSRYTPVARVVWTREVMGQGPRRTESIPFLSIARSLGDYWSFVPRTEKYAVSPMPDLAVRRISDRDRYLVLVSDGITHVMKSSTLGDHLQEIFPSFVRYRNRIENPARMLLKRTMEQWRNLKSDNMSILCVGLHHDGTKDPFNHLPTTFRTEEQCNLETFFSDFQRDIGILTQDGFKAVRPEFDDLIVKKPYEDGIEEYAGPGFVDEIEPPQDPSPEPEAVVNDGRQSAVNGVVNRVRVSYHFEERRALSWRVVPIGRRSAPADLSGSPYADDEENNAAVPINSAPANLRYRRNNVAVLRRPVSPRVIRPLPVENNNLSSDEDNSSPPPEDETHRASVINTNIPRLVQKRSNVETSEDVIKAKRATVH